MDQVAILTQQAQLDKTRLLQYSIKSLEKAAESTSLDGNSKVESNPSAAYVSLLKSTSLVLEIIPKHSQSSLKFPQLQLQAGLDISTLELLQKKIIEQYQAEDLKKRIHLLKNASSNQTHTADLSDVLKNPLLKFPHSLTITISELVPFIQSNSLSCSCNIIFVSLSSVDIQLPWMRYYLYIPPIVYKTKFDLTSSLSANNRSTFNSISKFDIIAIFDDNSTSMDTNSTVMSIYDILFDVAYSCKIVLVKGGYNAMKDIKISEIKKADVPTVANNIQIGSIFDDPYFNFSNRKQTTQDATLVQELPSIDNISKAAIKNRAKKVDEQLNKDLKKLPELPIKQPNHQEFRFHDNTNTLTQHEYGVGLKNLGNTCYMNASLQALKGTSPFNRYFTSGRFKKDINTDNPLGHSGKLATSMFKILSQMSSPEYFQSYCVPSDLKQVVSNTNPMFQGSEQHDASEFISFILDGLHEDLKRKGVKYTNLTEREEIEWESKSIMEYSRFMWEKWCASNNSIINLLFHGQLASILKCQFCQFQSTSFNAFNMLSIPITNKSKCHLNDCLSEFSKPEQLLKDNQWKCPKCKILRDADKTLKLTILPDILILHLKRFAFDGNFKSKISAQIEFPNYNLKVENAFGQSTRYDLYAVVYQFGGLDSGHYTSACKYVSKWFYFDDTRICDMNDFDFKAAYVLFYVKSE
eukprot:NODE_290_length_11632_cov_0.441256.p2 type:complete len:694 gc:universal NODE_290_length_11632_cov_0.441256:8457-6376(-)